MLNYYAVGTQKSKIMNIGALDPSLLGQIIKLLNEYLVAPE